MGNISKLLKLKMIINKKNGQININIPKKKIPKEIKKNMSKFERANIFLKGFE